MKKTIIVSLIFIMVLFTGCSPGTSPNPDRVNFTFSEFRSMRVPVKINDSISANMLFDTGYATAYFTLDPEFCKANPYSLWDTKPNMTMSSSGSAWVAEKTRPASIYETPATINICGTNQNYDCFEILNLKSQDGTGPDGAFGFSQHTSTQVWELNFEHNYMEIHPAEDFKMPEECYSYPMQKGTAPNLIYIQFPIKVTCSDGDTITIHRPFIVDTGMGWDVAILNPAEEFAFFDNRDDAILIDFQNDYECRYDVNAKVFDNFEIDSLRIYTLKDSPAVRAGQYLIGMNFLKRFNVFFDFSTRQVGLQPVKNFTRLYSPYFRLFYFSTEKQPDGRRFVKMVANTKDNPYKEAGMQKGDEIIAVNGVPVKDMTPVDAKKISDSATRTFDLKRDEQPLRIVVELDEDYLRGE